MKVELPSTPIYFTLWCYVQNIDLLEFNSQTVKRRLNHLLQLVFIPSILRKFVHCITQLLAFTVTTVTTVLRYVSCHDLINMHEHP